MSPASIFKPLNSCLIFVEEDFMLKDWNFLFSIVTAITAIGALVLSIRQMRLSNKQNLFDRRLKAYMLANGLISLCEENYKWLLEKRETEPQWANDYIFMLITNNAYMESQTDAINHPLEQPFHKEFLRKREELRNTAMEVELIFKGEVALTYSEFLRAYESVLATMYQYQIIIDKMMKENEKQNKKQRKEVEFYVKMFHEEKYRESLYDAREKLKKAYDTVTKDNIKKQMEKQLKLI